MWNEKALLIPCKDEQLAAILHQADNPNGRGLLLIVGGPQYRVGSHRQFVEFSRAMANSGTTVLRFDYRGMGDSSGPYLEFEQIEDDLAVALDAMVEQVPGLEDICVFGLCDAASSALMFAAHDPRVTEMVLLNPWVRSDASEAKAVMKHYYGQRLLQWAFWRKLFSGEVKVFASIRDVLSKWKLSKQSNTNGDAATSPNLASADFRERMLAGAQHFRGRVLLLLSGNDFTANEFEDAVAQSQSWQNCVQRWTTIKVPQANHTFSRSDWKNEVVNHTLKWMGDR